MQWKRVTSVTQPGPALHGFPVNQEGILLGGPGQVGGPFVLTLGALPPWGAPVKPGPRAARGLDDLLPLALMGASVKCADSERCAVAAVTVAQKVQEGKEPGRPGIPRLRGGSMWMCCPAGCPEQGLSGVTRWGRDVSSGWCEKDLLKDLGF